MTEGLSEVFNRVLGPAIGMFATRPVHATWLAIMSFSALVALIPILMIVLSPVIGVAGLVRLYNMRGDLFNRSW